MNLVYKTWRKFCSELKKSGFHSLPAYKIESSMTNYIVLKHDVETKVKNAYEIACIEHEYGLHGSYYVQAYLMEKEANVVYLKKMQNMGHEISYHYDVMDSCHGNIDSAIEEFEKNRLLFESHGFHIHTVCQHGNPVVERVGYTSNRDFFRNKRVRQLYPDIADIMVNYQQDYSTDYQYFSDAGRCFRYIFDPLNNDIEDTSNKDITYAHLDELLQSICSERRYIVSIHPHRWTKSSFQYVIKTWLFRGARAIAKLVMRVPYVKKIMSKYYYLAKRI